MSDEITASFDSLMHQAPMTVGAYVDDCLELLVGLNFNQEERVQILPGLVIACAIDFSGAVLAQQLRAGLQETRTVDDTDALSSIADALERFPSAIESLKDK